MPNGAMNMPGYGGPHKIVQMEHAERPMTDAEKLKADKEQLKLK